MIPLGLCVTKACTPSKRTHLLHCKCRFGRTAQEICRYLERRYDLHYSPEDETVVTVGGSEAIDLALRAMLDPGDEVVYAEPCYVSYLPCIVLADGASVAIPLQEKNQFRLTKEELEAAITPKTKVLILSYPNNPTGAVISKETGGNR